MDYEIRNIDDIEVKDMIILPLFENSIKDSNCNITLLSEGDSVPKKVYEYFKGCDDQSELVHFNTYSLYLVGLGKEINWNKLVSNIANVVSKIYGHKNIETVQILLTCSNLDLELVINAFMISFYRFIDYKTIGVEKYIKKVYFVVDIDEYDKCNLSIQMGSIINEIRGLTNSPRNDINVDNLASYISETCVDNDMYVDIFNRNKLKSMGFNLICGVGDGSMNAPKMAVIHYNNLGDTQPIVLIGKGVLYDSGGYNIKRGSMYYMNDDMYGSVLVYGIIRVCKVFGIRINIVGILPLVENMVSDRAQRPSDICRSYGGLTVDIVDTDAEGRLILADALGYAATFNPSLVIAMATLTGGSDKIFSNKSSIMYSLERYKKFVTPLVRIGKKYGETVTYLPILEEMMDVIKSNRADVKNTDLPGCGKAARIAYPAVFLERFAPRDVPFIFWDISHMCSNNDEALDPGITGYGLRLIVSYIKKLANSITPI